MNELATLIKEDGQPLRAIMEYVSDTFQGIKHEELFADVKFTDYLNFVEFIEKVVCPAIKHSTTEFRLDSPEEYEALNSK